MPRQNIFEQKNYTSPSIQPQKKIPGSVLEMKSTWNKVHNYGKTKNKKKRVWKSANDHGGFQQQSPQRLVDEYEYMNNRNDR